MTKMAMMMFWMLGVVGGASATESGTGSVTYLRNDNKNDNNENMLLVLQSRFADWMRDFEKEYDSIDEQEKRFNIWLENHFFMEQHNHPSTKSTFTVGHNQFSDMTLDEYKQYNRLGEYSPGTLSPPSLLTGVTKTTMAATTSHRRDRSLQDVPTSMNWVELGAVPPVKNQGMCGSCWAFSAIGSIEGKHFLDTGVLIPLSEQQLIDCDKLDLGCGGGLMDNAFLFDENSTGICSEIDYPYAGHKRWLRGCASLKGECDPVQHTRVLSFTDVPNTADELIAALAQQTVSVAIEADLQSFQFYRSGVYSDENCDDKLDHGVLAVGYGTTAEEDDTDDGIEYFLVRNSWGATWGDAGYIKMAKVSPHVNGTCGILAAASRPALRDD